jgi:hypothetical protein
MKSYAGIWIVFLSTCSIGRTGDRPAAPPVDVSYCQIAKDPSAWIGKRIRVRAIYNFGFEIERLQSPACCPEKGSKIWVQVGSDVDGRSEKIFHKLDKVGAGSALAVFVGRFEESPGRMGERFRLVVDEIERVEKTARARDPVTREWVPKHCEVD